MYSCTETRPEVDGCVVSAFGSGRSQDMITVQENHRFNRGIKAIIDRDSEFSCISLLMGDQCDSRSTSPHTDSAQKYASLYVNRILGSITCSTYRKRNSF